MHLKSEIDRNSDQYIKLGPNLHSCGIVRTSISAYQQDTISPKTKKSIRHNIVQYSVMNASHSKFLPVNINYIKENTNQNDITTDMLVLSAPQSYAE